MRIQKWFLLMVLLVLTMGTASAKLTGRNLLRSCHSAISVLNNNNKPTHHQDAYRQLASAGACEGYVVGIAESIPSNLFCPPSDNDYQQFIRVVYNYLNEHPKELSLPASALTFKVLTDTFPCEQKK
jgi:hypothetical protein